METQEKRALAASPLSDVSRLGAICALVVSVVFATFEITGIFTSPLVGAFSGDETINYYLAARNFNAYGFPASSFLQDFSTSSTASEHPFVYDHMAAGPEIIVALLTRVVGERWWVTRLFFAAIFFGGLYFYFRFATILLGNLGLRGAGFAFLLLFPPTLMYLLDSPGHAAFPLLAFYPLVAMHQWRQTGRACHYWGALSAVFLSTLVLPYQQVLLILANTFFLSVFRLFAVTKRDALAFTAMAAAGVFLHIGQNVWHLGMDVAVKELMLTISNRMTGHPTGQELVDFYQSINVVHHGAHSFRPKELVRAYFNCVNPYFSCINVKTMAVAGAVLLGSLCVVFRIPWLRSKAATLAASPMGGMPQDFAKLVGWCLGSLVIPVFAFPAYAVDYNLQGTGHFLGAIVGLAFLLYVIRAITSLPLNRWALVTCLGLLALALAPFLARQIKAMAASGKQAFVNKNAFVEQIEARAAQRVTMTNLYPAFVGFFTRENVFGVAELEAFTSDGQPNPSGAYHKFIHNFQTADHYRPTLYILSRVQLPGHAKSTDEKYREQLRQLLLAHHRCVYEDESMAIFELNWQTCTR